jgi:ankyrin repeat protein
MDIVWQNTKNREVAYQAIMDNTYDCPVQHGWNQLTYAAYRGHVAVVDALLIDLEWDPDMTDLNGLTALYAAALGNQGAMVNRLLYWGASPDLEEPCA